VPELPDVTIYRERLTAFVAGHVLMRVQIVNPFVLRTVTPSPGELHGTRIKGIETLGKRLVLECEHGRFVVLHLMIAGRLRWRPPGKKLPGKLSLVAFEFDHGTLFLSEAGATRRASMHIVEGRDALQQFERGGINPMTSSAEAYAASLRRERHTLKRSLTDPRLFSGIGNAYSDEILHAARLSPMQMSTALLNEDIARLREATIATLTGWTDRLRQEVGTGFPEIVTAFHQKMAVHGRFGHPCPECGAPVQRIRYADNETNYCARCQTGGRILADRALSRLLKSDFPRRLDELEG
jgi:formamidopyrimidine-DNA glycosylase